MATILVADDQDSINLADPILSGEGHRVVEAEDGQLAFELAARDKPDLILLAVGSQNMNGLQVLQSLKSDPGTRFIPVIVSTVGEDEKSAQLAVRAGALDYIAKPWPSGHLSDRIRIALNRSGGTVSTGNDGIDRVLLGGVGPGVLTLVEGASGSGKSVLCQHLAYGALMLEHSVTIYAQEVDHPDQDGTKPDFAVRMKNLGMDISFEMQGDQARIYPLGYFVNEEPGSGKALEGLREHIESLSMHCSLIILDDLTQMVKSSGTNHSINFFNECRLLCNPEFGIIIALDTAGMKQEMLGQVENLINTHVRLSAQNSKGGVYGTRVHLMEVPKVKDTYLNWTNMVSFEVDPALAISMSMGLRVIPAAGTNG